MVHGAMSWLHDQPEADAQRAKVWLEGLHPLEQNLRTTLRQPLHTFGGPPSVRDEEALHHEKRQRNDRADKIQHMVSNFSKQLGPDAPLVSHAQRRVERIRDLRSPTLQNQTDTTPVIGDPPRLKEPFSFKGLDIDVSRGTSGCAVSTSGFAELQAYCTQLQPAIVPDMNILVTSLVRASLCEEQKAWAVFCWVSHHITSKVGEPQTRGNVEDTFKQNVGSAYEVADLFKALCCKAGLTAELVAGCARTSSALQCDEQHENDDQGTSSIQEHTWSRVLVEEDWILVDCFQASGCIGRFGADSNLHTYFFGPCPEHLAHTHLPGDPKLQMLADCINEDSFRALPEVQPEVFFGSKLQFASLRPCGNLLLEDTNSGLIRIKVPPDVKTEANVDGEPLRCLEEDNAQIRTATVRVSILSAHHLPKADVHGGSDPYCTCEIVGRPRTGFRTRSLNDTDDPVWNEHRVIENCVPGERVRFQIYDKDIGTKDYLLGSATLPLWSTLAGNIYEDDLSLNDSGLEGVPKLRVKLEMLSVTRRPSAVPSRSRKHELRTIHYRVPLDGAPHLLHIRACQEGLSRDHLRVACSFNLMATKRMADIVAPWYPFIDWSVCHSHNLEFTELLPIGRFDMHKSNEVSLRLAGPENIQVHADLDGDSSAALLQYAPDTNSLQVTARCPKGEHVLKLKVRRGPAGDLCHAACYRLVVFPHCIVDPAPFPQVLDRYHQVRGGLQAPLFGNLRRGSMYLIRISLDPQQAASLVARTPGGASKPLNNAGVGLFEGKVIADGTELLLDCTSTDGETMPIVRWSVLPS